MLYLYLISVYIIISGFPLSLNPSHFVWDDRFPFLFFFLAVVKFPCSSFLRSAFLKVSQFSSSSGLVSLVMSSSLVCDIFCTCMYPVLCIFQTMVIFYVLIILVRTPALGMLFHNDSTNLHTYIHVNSFLGGICK